MKTKLSTVFLLLAACVGPGNEPASDAAPVVAFTHVNVIPMDAQRVLEDHTVLVSGGLISQVGPAAEVEIPGGATVVDGAGKYQTRLAEAWVVPTMPLWETILGPPIWKNYKVSNWRYFRDFS